MILNSASDVTAGGAAVRLNLTSTDAGTYTVTLSKRQTEISSVKTTLAAGVGESLMLTPPSWADGVLVATVKKADGTPVAERMIFRSPSSAVHVEVSSDKSSYNPADKVTVTIKTTDDAGKPIPAMVGLTATDQSILRMLEKRDRAPRLAEMALLEDDVRELADAETYLDPTDPKSATATDLLLGTQGWRRFATVDREKFIAKYGDAGRRMLGDKQTIMPNLTWRRHRFRSAGGTQQNVPCVSTGQCAWECNDGACLRTTAGGLDCTRRRPRADASDQSNT